MFSVGAQIVNPTARTLLDASMDTWNCLLMIEVLSLTTIFLAPMNCKGFPLPFHIVKFTFIITCLSYKLPGMKDSNASVKKCLDKI